VNLTSNIVSCLTHRSIAHRRWHLLHVDPRTLASCGLETHSQLESHNYKSPRFFLGDRLPLLYNWPRFHTSFSKLFTLAQVSSLVTSLVLRVLHWTQYKAARKVIIVLAVYLQLPRHNTNLPSRETCQATQGRLWRLDTRLLAGNVVQ
jgi:hypothetical protein